MHSTLLPLILRCTLALVAAPPILFLFPGCASVKALPAGNASDETLLRPPSVIYIQPFDTSTGIWQGDVAAPEERERVSDWLTAELESELAHIAPTRLADPEKRPDSGWLITGRFVRVNPGSKLQRMFLGLGAGGSKLETRVSIFDLAVSTSQPILGIQTTGGSNLEAGPSALVNNAQMNDIVRTAREVRDFIENRIWSNGKRRAPAEPAADEALEPIEIRRGPGR